MKVTQQHKLGNLSYQTHMQLGQMSGKPGTQALPMAKIEGGFAYLRGEALASHVSRCTAYRQ